VFGLLLCAPAPIASSVKTTHSHGEVRAWLGAQHHQEDIVQRARQPIALHVAGAMVVTEVAGTVHTRFHLIPRQGAVGAVADQDLAQSLAGQNLVHLYGTHLLRFSLSNQFEKLLRFEQRSNLIFEMFSYVMLGATVKKRPKSCMMYSWLLVSKFGSAKMILALGSQ
jgi:hypothetical protein